MSDQPFYGPNHVPAPRPPRRGEHLWTVRKNGGQLDCELRVHGAWGVEVQVYVKRPPISRTPVNPPSALCITNPSPAPSRTPSAPVRTPRPRARPSSGTGAP